jgi:hypothetical protein
MAAVRTVEPYLQFKEEEIAIVNFFTFWTGHIEDIHFHLLKARFLAPLGMTQ